MQWNTAVEKNIKEIGENSRSYKILHLNESQRTNRIYNRIMILGILVGPLSGVLTSIETALYPPENIIIVISTIFLSFLSGIVMAIIKFGAYDQKAKANKEIATKYLGIENNVRRQLSLTRKDRINASKYVEWLETKYDEVFLNAPILTNIVLKKFEKQAKENGFKIPDKYSTEIFITKEPSEEEKKITRDYTSNNIICNDKMLEYEMKRLTDAYD